MGEGNGSGRRRTNCSRGELHAIRGDPARPMKVPTECAGKTRSFSTFPIMGKRGEERVGSAVKTLVGRGRENLQRIKEKISSDEAARRNATSGGEEKVAEGATSNQCHEAHSQRSIEKESRRVSATVLPPTIDFDPQGRKYKGKGQKTLDIGNGRQGHSYPELRKRQTRRALRKRGTAETVEEPDRR